MPPCYATGLVRRRRGGLASPAKVCYSPIDAFTLSANVSGIGTLAFLSESEPVLCKCTIPNTSNWRRSLVYGLGSETPPTVIEAR